MPSVKKLKNGRYKATYQNKLRRIPRTRLTFDTSKEAWEWIDAVKKEGTARLLGHRRRRLFGEALVKYLREESPKKASHADDLSNARALRWPIFDKDTRRWLRLEETPLDDVPAVLSKWSADQREVLKRVFTGSATYHLRPDKDGPVWWQQPDPELGEKPQARVQVKDRFTLAVLDRTIGRGPFVGEKIPTKLIREVWRECCPDVPQPKALEAHNLHRTVNAIKGEGPFSSGTLRLRQLLVHRILFTAWKYWSSDSDVWLDKNIAEKIQLDSKAPPREAWLKRRADLDNLLNCARKYPGMADAILGAILIGWRAKNQLLLEWPTVVFPVFQVGADGVQKKIQDGYIRKERVSTKGKRRALMFPITDQLYELLKHRWEQRVECPDSEGVYYVFHDGTGRPLLRHRKIIGWYQTRKAANLEKGFCWHSLRHTFVSWLFEGGANSKEIAELGGWSETRTVEQTYTHIHIDRLSKVANLINTDDKQ